MPKWSLAAFAVALFALFGVAMAGQADGDDSRPVSVYLADGPIGGFEWG